MATLFLDYDGTLHDTMRIYGPGFRRGYAWLVEQGYVQPREFTDEWISRWLGWTIEDMWMTFLPGLPEPVWRQAAHEVGREMNRITQAGRGGLYLGAEEALDQLKAAGHTLVVLSNCTNSYIASHRQAYGLDRWFSRYLTAEDHPDLAKWEIYRTVADDAGCPRPHVMVGDRFHDLEAGVKNGLPTIGCAYGFGEPTELEAATVVISSIAELPDAVEHLLG